MYLIILTIVVVFLSSTLYTVHGQEVRELGTREPATAQDTVLEHYLERLARSIVLTDLLTILGAGLLSYYLAGRTLRPIRQAVEARQQFFANAAHDLRTPLAVLRTEAEVALRQAELPPEEARQVLLSSLEEVDRMSRMVEDLLLLALEGKQELRREPHDLADLVGTVVQRLDGPAREKSLTLQWAPSPPVLVPLDAPAVERALVNVLGNSLRYTLAGGRVEVSLTVSRDAAQVLVVDDGMGISPEDLPHVLDPLYRADQARSSSPDGAGLGLAIVQRIVTEHGGTVEIESPAGKGTRVKLRFPLR